jgi:hypothetical protein
MDRTMKEIIYCSAGIFFHTSANLPSAHDNKKGKPSNEVRKPRWPSLLTAMRYTPLLMQSPVQFYILQPSASYSGWHSASVRVLY